jgi:cell division protein FtsB
MLDKTNILNRLEPYLDYGRAYILSLRDVRNVGLLVFTVIVLLISWSGVKSIQTNYGLQKQIVRLTQENEVRSLQNTNLALQNRYLDTPQYLEISARQNLGLAAPGETWRGSGAIRSPQTGVLAAKLPGLDRLLPAPR